jgi:flagellar motor switch protein FliN
MADELDPNNLNDSAAGADGGSNLIDQSELDALVQQLKQTGGAKPGQAKPFMPVETKVEPVVAPATQQTPIAVEPKRPTGPAPMHAEPPTKPAVVGSQAPALPIETAVPLDVPDLSRTDGQEELGGIDLLDDVELDVKVELGRAQMYIEDVLRLGEGSVIELDKLAGDPVDIYVNERLMARGEVLVLNENFCVRINDIMSPAPEASDTK